MNKVLKDIKNVIVATNLDGTKVSDKILRLPISKDHRYGNKVVSEFQKNFSVRLVLNSNIYVDGTNVVIDIDQTLSIKQYRALIDNIQKLREFYNITIKDNAYILRAFHSSEDLGFEYHVYEVQEVHIVTPYIAYKDLSEVGKEWMDELSDLYRPAFI